MGFARYQDVRNRMLGAFAVIGATVGGIFGYQSMSESSGTTDRTAARSQWEEETPSPAPTTPSRNMASVPTQSLAGQKPQSRSTPLRQTTQTTQTRPATKTQRYVSAMKLATSSSRRAAKAKDVLGSRSPWKLNLYDDNQDGTWDRAKLDINRDEVEDEKWTYKNGYWEKDNGLTVWANGKWIAKLALTNSVAGSASDQKLARYRVALMSATAQANPSGKGKDVLGSGSPWKLNLYDDDRDGQWDRAKLDTNRDEVDDEKWTFKQGRWEKDGGKLVWANDNWMSASALANAAPTTDLGRYRAAFKIASARADSSGKGKDVLGSKSPWKLNLYDDDQDGQWDRAKLDTNRDEEDDEKWTFKNSRWEKENGTKVWATDNWVSASLAANPASDSQRYLAAFKVATARADSSGKGKDVLGSKSPWKLNLYDDDRDGQWDRAKLDTNRDEVDDEKWTFKQGRWEKENGTKIWVGDRWE